MAYVGLYFISDKINKAHIPTTQFATLAYFWLQESLMDIYPTLGYINSLEIINT